MRRVDFSFLKIEKETEKIAMYKNRMVSYCIKILNNGMRFFSISVHIQFRECVVKLLQM